MEDLRALTMRMMTDHLAQYARALVGARIQELTVAELIAALTGPDAALPAEITGEVLDVLSSFATGLAARSTSARGRRHPPRKRFAASAIHVARP